MASGLNIRWKHCTAPAHADSMTGMEKRRRIFIGDGAGSGSIVAVAMEEDISLSQSSP